MLSASASLIRKLALPKTLNRWPQTLQTPIHAAWSSSRQLGTSSGSTALVGASWRAPRNGNAAGGLTAAAFGSSRGKQTKRQSYYKPPNAQNTLCGQSLPNKAHIGVKAMPAEYVEAGRLICKQRKFIAKNPFVRRKRHFKLYPGVNVKVMKNTSLQAAVSGRVKMTHDVTRDVMVMNVLAEPREELLRDEMWRYRTEHVESLEENKLLIHLRSKALPVFGKEWVNPPTGPRVVSVRVAGKTDGWNRPTIKDPYEIEPFAYPMTRHMLARHIKKVRAKHAGVPDEQNDPDFEITDTRAHLFRGQAAQR
eukprot:TRINITY_DN112316_c0_g1_i1.p2 TRINITY_DN112316_c0_g1~~TRINITY_DN112316_c0_g1_i1.p2  ORF type:complete len:308 (-),score=66.23 TRINITY_DN112316_c0_g1_i1:235-1158(-)